MPGQPLTTFNSCFLWTSASQKNKKNTTHNFTKILKLVSDIHIYFYLDFDKLMLAAQIGSEAITKAQGRHFEVGPIIPSSGGPYDWAKGSLEIPYAYGLQLRDKERYVRDKTTNLKLNYNSGDIVVNFSTSKWVLPKPFAGQNQLYQSFLKFFWQKKIKKV